MYKDYNMTQLTLPMETSVLIPTNDISRHVNDIVETIPETEFDEFRHHRGATSYHPKMMLKVVLYAYTQSVFSGRKIEKLLNDSIRMMWLSQNQKPSYKTINRFRVNPKVDALLESLFIQFHSQCLKQNLIDDQAIFIDGTKVEANANRYTFVWKKSIQNHESRMNENSKALYHELVINKIIPEIKKDHDNELTKEEIDFFIKGYTNGDIPDYQASSLAMAIFFQDMTEEERANLTMAMVNSGDVIDLSNIDGIKVDKHSTGGVGDTTTLVLAPLVASVGVPVAKMSGRGLGHTGGTIDKLESAKGFHVELSEDEFVKLVNENQVAVMGQSGNLTPADKKLYALRDVTGTVNSIPLIASSIMSKKIAAGADAIVLDVKTGSGAFMKTIEDAEALAHAMVRIGNNIGRNTMAIISDMSQPLGNAIGNGLELKEAIETLKGQGPDDLTELVLTLGSQMVVLAKQASTLDEAREYLTQSIESGKALEKFKTFISNQGGDVSIIERPDSLEDAKYKIEYTAQKDGFISEMVANEIGVASMMLGAGRQTKEDVIDLSVGIVLNKKVGDKVKAGESILTIHSNKENIDDIFDKLNESIRIDSESHTPTLIHKIITE